MKVTAKMSETDQLYFKQMLVKAERKSVKFANKMIKGIANRFFISARKRTGPDNRSKIKSMKKKNRIRPVVTLSLNKQMNFGQFWYKDNVTGKIFMRPKPISKKSRFKNTIDDEKSRLTPVTRAVKKWSKKKRRWVFTGTDKRKGLNGGDIPHAGAAKAGWIQGQRNLGYKANTSIGKLSKRVARTRFLKGVNPVINHTNNIEYVSKISPGVVAASLNAAANWFRVKETGKFNRLTKKEFRGSFKS
jgi:hypothetical protein